MKPGRLTPVDDPCDLWEARLGEKRLSWAWLGSSLLLSRDLRESWLARTLAAARARPAAVRLDRLVGSTRGVAARRVTKRVLRVSPVARMVALAAAAVMVTAVATLALVVVANARLV